MLNPQKQLPGVIDLLRAIAWSYWRKTGVNFDELLSECYVTFMACCKSYDKAKGMKFSSWCQYKASMHLKTYLKRKYNDRLIFVEEIVDEMLPPEPSIPMRNSIADQTAELSPEARKLVRLLVSSPEEDMRSPTKVLRKAITELSYEGIDPVFQDIILHEIKQGIAK